MSTNTLITRTSGRGVEPNRSRLLDRHGQMFGVIRQQLGPEHAALLAEPMRMGVGSASDIAWYAEGDVEPVPLGSLPPDAASRVRLRLERLTSEIVRLAQSLEQKGDASQELANLLRAAVLVPDDSCVWVAGEQPILVDWGRSATGSEPAQAPAIGAIIAASGDAGSPQPKMMQATASGQQPPPSPPKLRTKSDAVLPQRRSRSGVSSALWVLFVVLLTMIAARLLHACGVGGPSWPTALRDLFPQYCTATVTADPLVTDVIASLEAQVRASELALTRKVAACEVSCPALPQRAASPSLLPIQEEITRRLPSTVERGQHLEITLTWEGNPDLDLHVACPSGAIINYRNGNACGGRLVADLNRAGGTPQSRAVEHIIWADAPPASGIYEVGVAMYNRFGDARHAIPYQIAIWRNGRVVREERREISTVGVVEPVLTLTSPLQ
jgi:hypothetical protein